jgi:hypothetical protein
VVGAANLGCGEIALIDKLSISMKHNLMADIKRF